MASSLSLGPLDFPEILAIAYFAVYSICAIAAALAAYTTRSSTLYTPFGDSKAEELSCTINPCGSICPEPSGSLCKRYPPDRQCQKRPSCFAVLWTSRMIYTQIMVHIVDTASDAGVICQWYLLSRFQRQNGRKFEVIDMETLFITSLVFIILYRVLSMLIAIRTACRYEKEPLCTVIMDAVLGLLDLFVIKAVYRGIKEDDMEPTATQKVLQFAESLLESIPQVNRWSLCILKSVYSTPYTTKHDNQCFVAFEQILFPIKWLEFNLSLYFRQRFSLYS